MNTLRDTDERKARPSVWPVYVAGGCIIVLLLFLLIPLRISTYGWKIPILVGAGVGLVLVARAMWREGALLTIAALVAMVSGPLWIVWPVFTAPGRDASPEAQAQLAHAVLQWHVIGYVFLAAVALSLICLLRRRPSAVDVDD